MLRRAVVPDPEVEERLAALFAPRPALSLVEPADGEPLPESSVSEVPLPEVSWTPRSKAAGGWTPTADGPPAPVVPTSVVQTLRTAVLDPGRRGALALVAVALVAAVVAGLVLLRSRPSADPVAAPSSIVAGAGSSEPGTKVVVDVAGTVRHPGLVSLPAGSRVDDALKAAGGVLPGSSTGGLNLARKLVDGEQVVVGPAVAAPGAPGAAPSDTVDLNSATASDLDGLPGIGPVLAQRIVDYRTEHGPYGSVDQLRQVSGIGESKYQSIKAKVHV